jgi:hypothetical protein
MNHAFWLGSDEPPYLCGHHPTDREVQLRSKAEPGCNVPSSWFSRPEASKGAFGLFCSTPERKTKKSRIETTRLSYWSAI